MKRVVLVILAMVLVPMISMGQISGSAHDFSDETWSTNDICGPCHTPHNSFSGGAPLWNHSNTANSAWTMYDNTNGTQNSSVSAEPSAVSKACLSCHDGSISVDAMGGGAGSINISAYGAGLQIGNGGDLSADHPLSITYDNSLYIADGGLHDPTNAAVSSLLIGAKVECASCHDPHYAGNAKLLAIDNTDSALCLTCHDK